MALMLRNGTPLPEALSLAAALESGTPAGKSLAHWRQVTEAGKGKPTQWLGEAGPFPPLFLWLVQQSGEDIAGGFQKAAEIYRTRAACQGSRQRRCRWMERAAEEFLTAHSLSWMPSLMPMKD